MKRAPRGRARGRTSIQHQSNTNMTVIAEPNENAFVNKQSSPTAPNTEPKTWFEAHSETVRGGGEEERESAREGERESERAEQSREKREETREERERAGSSEAYFAIERERGVCVCGGGGGGGG